MEEYYSPKWVLWDTEYMETVQAANLEIKLDRFYCLLVKYALSTKSIKHV